MYRGPRTSRQATALTVTDNTVSGAGAIGAPVDAFVKLIRGRYKADIVILLGKKERRFSELRRAIPRISERVLARQLDALERDGIVRRTAFAEVPPRVQYSLTAHGKTLCPIIKQIWKWGTSVTR